MGREKAPKDPEKRRPFFYIIKEKEIFGTIQTRGQEKGKGIQFIYESDGRLVSSAKVVGNIEDEAILKHMETVEGFRQLVHSIGISVETQNTTEHVTFLFQMYGKTDLYGGGTMLREELHGDGAEVRINLDEIEWSSDDDVPGQIRFVFDTPELMAKASVRLFLKEGFDVPEPEEEHPIDIHSKDYQDMIERSLMSIGNSRKIHAVVEKAKRGELVTLAYIGGSITQGAGAIPIHTQCYASQSYRAFAQKYGMGENVRLIKAGVGGTSSELGMIRFERDVLRDGTVEPDLVIVEFAVNDEGDETKGICYESLVKKILDLPQKPAVLLLFSVFANDWNLQERLSPVGYNYHLPMVSVRNAVSPQFKLAPGEGKVLLKSQFFYDAFHPTNLGHKIMADCLMNLFEKVEMSAERKTEEEIRVANETAVIGNTFTKVKLLDRKDIYQKAIIKCGAFSHTDQDLQYVEMDESLLTTPEFPYNWQYDGTVSEQNEAFYMHITCRALLLIFKDSGEVNAGRAEVFVDGEKVLTADPHVNGWTHCNATILFEDKESREHEIILSMAEGDQKKKFTILGFGYVE